MAAPLIRHLRFPILSVNQKVYSPVRFKYWEKAEDSIYEIGERRSDRYVGVPQKQRPHPETPIKGQYELNPLKGKIYDKKPFPAELKAGKKYKWCVCGYSKSQPFCDGNHKMISRVLWKAKGPDRGSQGNVLHNPFTFEVEKDGKYWLCNCKQTDNHPFCDGTHKQEHIQTKVKS